MKRFAKTKNDDIGRIPNIALIRPIAIEPELAIGKALDIPNVRIAIEVGFLMRAISSVTTPLEILANTLGVEFYMRS